MHHLIVQQLATERYERLAAEAERARRRRAVAPPSRARLTVARLLIGAGERLARRRPAARINRPVTLSTRP